MARYTDNVLFLFVKEITGEADDEAVSFPEEKHKTIGNRHQPNHEHYCHPAAPPVQIPADHHMAFRGSVGLGYKHRSQSQSKQEQPAVFCMGFMKYYFKRHWTSVTAKKGSFGRLHVHSRRCTYCFPV